MEVARLYSRQQGTDEATCPIDNRKLPVAKVFEDVKEQRKILSLAVKCTNQQELLIGTICMQIATCDWTGELRNYEDHCRKCLYEKVQCDNDCGETVERRTLAIHLLSFCARRKINCQYCTVEIEQREKQSHLTVCLKLPLLCLLDCGVKVKRENMAYHMSESGTCPNTLLSCLFKYAGCPAKVKRHEMDEHLATSVVQHQLIQQQAMAQQQQAMDQQQQAMAQQQQAMAQQQQAVAKELSHLRDENKELKRRLEANKAFHSWTMLQMIYKVPHQHGRMLSTCGQAVLQLNISPTSDYYSEPFLVHHAGYKAIIRVLGNGGVYEKGRNHLLVWISSSKGDCDSELKWPFRIRHTITLMDNQQEFRKEIDPTILDDRLAHYSFRVPGAAAPRRQSHLDNLRVEHATLRVSHSSLFPLVLRSMITVVIQADS